MISHKKALQIVKSIGMSIDDDLGFTVCAGQLVNGEDAPDWIAEMNGWDVYEIADKVQVLEKKHKQPNRN